jgi:hypothetical protein
MTGWSDRWDLPRLVVSLGLGLATAWLLFALSTAWISAHRPVVTLTGGLCRGGVNPVVVNDGQRFDPWTGLAQPMVVRSCDGQLQAFPMAGAALPLEVGFLPGFIGGWWAVGTLRRRRAVMAT